MPQLSEVDLNILVMFSAVADTGGFTAAAERLGVAKAKVSLQIGRLERQLGTSLFARTTRSVTLTEAGQALHEQCQPLLHAVQAALDQAGSGQAELGGRLRIGTTVDHAAQFLAPAIASFAALHPKLRIDVRADDRVVDLLSEGIDLAIRFGWLPDSSLRAVKLGEFDQYVIASPSYLRRIDAIRAPEDLAECEWVAFGQLAAPLTWKFSSHEGRTRQVQMKSRIRVNSPGSLRAMLKHGAGISILDQYSVGTDLESGSLVRLLDDWHLPRGGMYAVYPSSRHPPASVRAFIDFYRHRLQPS